MLTKVWSQPSGTQCWTSPENACPQLPHLRNCKRDHKRENRRDHKRENKRDLKREHKHLQTSRQEGEMSGRGIFGILVDTTGLGIFAKFGMHKAQGRGTKIGMMYVSDVDSDGVSDLKRDWGSDLRADYPQGLEGEPRRGQDRQVDLQEEDYREDLQEEGYREGLAEGMQDREQASVPSSLSSDRDGSIVGSKTEDSEGFDSQDGQVVKDKESGISMVHFTRDASRRTNQNVKRFKRRR
eukprot:1378133-Amorphochlora_amoeboformis.AAC.1